MKNKPPLWYTLQAILGTLLEEAALALIVLWVLPFFDIYIPWWGLALLMSALAVVAYITYRIGRGTFFIKPRGTMEALIGCEGVIVKALAPVIYVKVGGELWKAVCDECECKNGDVVEVIGAKDMTLIVRRKACFGNDNEAAEKEV